MTRRREILFGAIAIALLVAYVSLGSRIAPAFSPTASPTPTPDKPSTFVPLQSPAGNVVTGTIAFALRGDVYVLAGGGYTPLTSDGRSHQPSISPDGRTVTFTRIEAIDGKRSVDGQIVPAQLRFSNVVVKGARGGSETVLINGLVRSADGFHAVTWFDAPAVSPDGTRLAVVLDDGQGFSDLGLYDAQTGARMAPLSQGSNLADPAWSPDGRTIAVTSYAAGIQSPRILVVSADGGSANPVSTAAGEPYRPSYSPDGSWLVYTLRHEGRNDVRAVRVSGSPDIALTSDGKSWNGVFSPDGRQIAFLREQNGVIDLYAMELSDALTGGSPRPAVKLTRGEGIDGASRPAWGSG